MSRDFIGSKISIITKSQIRYSGTIIGIDAQTSSIILGNVKSFGTENRSGHSANGHMAGATLPIMQFANSDIEDLKIVDEEQQQAAVTLQKQSYSMPAVSSPPVPSTQQSSIHDDPAIVSAVMSSANKDSNSNGSISSRLIHNLQHMNLADGQSKSEESHLRSNSGELGPSWSLLSSSNWEQQNNPKPSSQQQTGNKSKFFDDFISEKNNNSNQHQFNRSHQRSSNTHSTQTSRENGGSQYDENGLPIRQPFFSNDRPYPQRQQQQQQQQQPPPPPHHQYQQQQQNRYQNGGGHQQQRYFHNNRRPPMGNQQRRPGGGGGAGGGNRETFQDNPNDYDADFDFETSNLKFNKLTNEDESKNPIDITIQPHIDADSSSDYPALYDKKKSFFDNLVLTEPSDGSAGHMFNRSKNTDTFGSDGYHRNNYRSNGYGYRRSNNNYRQQQQQQYGNEDFHYRQRNNNNNNGNSGNNGYHYRY